LTDFNSAMLCKLTPPVIGQSFAFWKFLAFQSILTAILASSQEYS